MGRWIKTSLRRRDRRPIRKWQELATKPIPQQDCHQTLRKTLQNSAQWPSKPVKHYSQVKREYIYIQCNEIGYEAVQ